MKLLRKFFPKPKPPWASLCTLAFTDRSGRRYYQYSDPMDMSILRKGEIEKCQIELRFGTDMEDICQAMQSAISSSDKKGNMAPDVTMIGYLVQELIDRKQYLVIPEILFRVLATTMIREDENPGIVDQEILAEKVITFQSELQHGGLFDFFRRGNMLGSLDFSGITIIDFKRLMTQSQQRMQSLKRIVSFSDSTLQSG